LATLTIFLGTRGLNEPDEGRYAEIAREMAASGEWLVPHLNGFEHFQKPPLFYWLTALSIEAFGANEWAVRLVPAMAALGVVLLTAAIARRLFTPEAGARTALILSSSVAFFALARLLTPDMVLTFWITAAIAALVFRRRWLFFVAMGLGFLTKGPMALVVPISAALAWQWTTRKQPDRFPLPWARGLAITLAIALSWFVTLSVRNPDLFDYFWRYELVQRFASKAHGRSQPFWFFAPAILVAMLPWTFFARGLVLTTWRRIRERQILPEQALLLGWVAPPFIILSLSGSKLPTYILPLLPALALALAASLRETRRVWQVAAPTAALCLLLAGNADRATPFLHQQASVRSLAALLKAQPDYGRAVIFTCEARAHGFEFYLQRLVRMTRNDVDTVLPRDAAAEARLFWSPDDCAQELANGPLAFGLVRQERFDRSFATGHWQTLGSAGDFLLISNRPGHAEMDARNESASGKTVTGDAR
jgi:4-amino-4-deoxy-L-arabinose transferase-like glycosyltransferase